MAEQQNNLSLDFFIINTGFHYIAEEIFENLDCFSLSRARQVSSTWKNFIESRRTLLFNILNGTKQTCDLKNLNNRKYYQKVYEYIEVYEFIQNRKNIKDLKMAVQAMTSFCVSNNNCPFDWALREGKIDFIKFLARQNDIYDFTDRRTKLPPFIVAIRSKNIEVIGCIMDIAKDRHMDLNSETLHGEPAFFDKEVLNFLMKTSHVSGLKIDSHHFNQTPFMAACAGNMVEALEVMLNHTNKINLNAADGNGNTGFQLACQNGCYSTVELLLKCHKKAGIKLNHRNSEGNTPFLSACINGQNEVVELLLTHAEAEGIWIDIINDTGHTPYDLIRHSNMNFEAKVKLFKLLPPSLFEVFKFSIISLVTGFA